MTLDLVQTIDFDAEEPSESPFVTLSYSGGLATAGDFVFAVDPLSSLGSQHTFAADGTLLSSADWNRFSNDYVWSEANQRVYFMTISGSPKDLFYGELSLDGTLGGLEDSPLHGGLSFDPPLSVAPDGSVVIIGSGAIFDAETLSLLSQALANPINGLGLAGQHSLFSSRIQRFYTGPNLVPNDVGANERGADSRRAVCVEGSRRRSTHGGHNERWHSCYDHPRLVT